MTEQPTSGSPPALELERLSKSYPGVQALRDVSFAIAGGEIHALLSENGAGKSTLLKIVSGAVRPDAGRIVLDGTALDLHVPLEARNAGIALIHQELALVPHMSAAANMYLGREVTRGVTLNRAAMETRAQELVDKLGVEIDVRRPVRMLSMAERQCVEIARALLFRARVLALDEPTSSLTNRECEALFTILRGLRAEGVAIIYVSHRLEEVAQIADRATVMRDGRVVSTLEVARTTRAELVTMMVGRDLSEMAQSPYRPPEAVALRVQHLSSAARLFDISFEAYRGQVLGIAGLVGSGRTELLRAVFGADPIDHGTIEVNGQPFAQRNVRGAIGRKMGLIPEDRKGQALFGRMSIRSNMTLASLSRFARGGVIQRRARQAEAEQLIADLDLRPRDSARRRPAFRRQSTESNRRPLVECQERHSPHRRADPRGRRRRQSRDLPPDRNAHGGRRSGHHGVVGFARGPADQRPHRGDARGPNRQGTRPAICERTNNHALRDGRCLAMQSLQTPNVEVVSAAGAAAALRRTESIERVRRLGILFGFVVVYGVFRYSTTNS
jgi:ribose transport system ATP-binding protein